MSNAIPRTRQSSWPSVVIGLIVGSLAALILQGVDYVRDAADRAH